MNSPWRIIIRLRIKHLSRKIGNAKWKWIQRGQGKREKLTTLEAWERKTLWEDKHMSRKDIRRKMKKPSNGKNEETEGSLYNPWEEIPRKRNRVKRTPSSLNTTLMAWRQFVKTCRTRGRKEKGLNPNLPPNNGGQRNWSTQSTTCPQAKKAFPCLPKDREGNTNLVPLKRKNPRENSVPTRKETWGQKGRKEKRREIKINSLLKPKQRDEEKDIGASPKWGWTRIPPKDRKDGAGQEWNPPIKPITGKQSCQKQTRTPPKHLALNVSSWELRRL